VFRKKIFLQSLFINILVGLFFRGGYNYYMIKNKSAAENSIDDVELGDHICSIYQNKKQQFSLLVPFFKAGLENNQKCVYIIDENSEEEILSEFLKRGIDLDKYIKSKQFELLTKKETYLKDGYFDPDKMIRLIKDTEENALKHGYLSMRLTGEMTWVLADESDIDQLKIYESKLTDFFLHSKSAAICQYNESKFTEDVLLMVLNTHPFAIIYGDLFENDYYSSVQRIKKAAELPFDLSMYENLKNSIINNKNNKKV